VAVAVWNWRGSGCFGGLGSSNKNKREEGLAGVGWWKKNEEEEVEGKESELVCCCRGLTHA